MKVLIVSDIKTHPTVSGASKFIMEYCNLIRNLGCEVYFLHITRYQLKSVHKKNNNEAVAKCEEYWGDYYFHYQESFASYSYRRLLYSWRKIFMRGYACCDDYYTYGLASYVNKLNREIGFDACLINYFWLSKLFDRIDIKKKGIITHDAYSYYNKRNPGMKKWFNLPASEEAKALQRCQYIFAMQDEEGTFFKYLSPESTILKCYCNYESNIQPIVGNHNLVFLSSGWDPNVYGINWFVKEVFRGIKTVFPDCRLLIGGSICSKLSHLKDANGIELQGFVDNPADFYRQGDVAINPTYLGAGLKIKTFEAISYGKVAMVHPHCTNGIYNKDKAPVFASSVPSEWVNFLKKLWNDDSLVQNIKEQDSIYLHNMNVFIKSQYEDFLKQ